METRGDRRGFMGSLGAGGLAAALMLAGRDAGADEPGGSREDGGRTFTGTGRNGDLFEAIEAALLDAIAAAKKGLTTDLVTWSLVDLVTESGGFTLDHTATATIRAKSGPRKGRDGESKKDSK
jgi:hypothetical protein